MTTGTATRLWNPATPPRLPTRPPRRGSVVRGRKRTPHAGPTTSSGRSPGPAAPGEDPPGRAPAPPWCRRTEHHGGRAERARGMSRPPSPLPRTGGLIVGGHPGWSDRRDNREDGDGCGQPVARRAPGGEGCQSEREDGRGEVPGPKQFRGPQLGGVPPSRSSGESVTEEVTGIPEVSLTAGTVRRAGRPGRRRWRRPCRRRRPSGSPSRDRARSRTTASMGAAATTIGGNRPPRGKRQGRRDRRCRALLPDGG